MRKVPLLGYGIIVISIGFAPIYFGYQLWWKDNLFAPPGPYAPNSWAMDSQYTSVWFDVRANMVALVEGNTEVELHGESTARAVSWGPDFVEFRDGRRVTRMEDTLLFVFADRQKVAGRLKSGQTEWFTSVLGGERLENAWEDIPALLSQYQADPEVDE